MQWDMSWNPRRLDNRARSVRHPSDAGVLRRRVTTTEHIIRMPIANTRMVSA